MLSHNFYLIDEISHHFEPIVRHYSAANGSFVEQKKIEQLICPVAENSNNIFELSISKINFGLGEVSRLFLDLPKLLKSPKVFPGFDKSWLREGRLLVVTKTYLLVKNMKVAIMPTQDNKYLIARAMTGSSDSYAEFRIETLLQLYPPNHFKFLYDTGATCENDTSIGISLKVAEACMKKNSHGITIDGLVNLLALIHKHDLVVFDVFKRSLSRLTTASAISRTNNLANKIYAQAKKSFDKENRGQYGCVKSTSVFDYNPLNISQIIANQPELEIMFEIILAISNHSQLNEVEAFVLKQMIEDMTIIVSNLNKISTKVSQTLFLIKSFAQNMFDKASAYAIGELFEIKIFKEELIGVQINNKFYMKLSDERIASLQQKLNMLINNKENLTKDFANITTSTMNEATVKNVNEAITKAANFKSARETTASDLILRHKFAQKKDAKTFESHKLPENMSHKLHENMSHKLPEHMSQSDGENVSSLPGGGLAVQRQYNFGQKYVYDVEMGSTESGFDFNNSRRTVTSTKIFIPDRSNLLARQFSAPEHTTNAMLPRDDFVKPRSATFSSQTQVINLNDFSKNRDICFDLRKFIESVDNATIAINKSLSKNNLHSNEIDVDRDSQSFVKKRIAQSVLAKNSPPNITQPPNLPANKTNKIDMASPPLLNKYEVENEQR